MAWHHTIVAPSTIVVIAGITAQKVLKVVFD
jgi:hypothetical protein